MLIRKCNLCKKVIKDSKDRIAIGRDWDTEEFCLNCGKKMLSKQGQKLIIQSK